MEKNKMIVIQTDFGDSWPFVAAMKGVCYSVCPDICIVDSTNHIESYSILEASQQLRYIEPYYPKGTIFLSVVDPGVGTARKSSIALLSDGNIVVTPDNGTLTHLAHDIGIEKVWKIKPNVRYCDDTNCKVFQGRDVFAYVAALLASGKETPASLGEAYPVYEIELLDDRFVRATKSDDGEYVGIVTSVSDPFGSIMTNIRTDDFVKSGVRQGQNFEIRISFDGDNYYNEIVSYETAFGAVGVGEPVLFSSSFGYMSVALNQRNFRDRYHIRAGLLWEIRINEKF